MKWAAPPRATSLTALALACLTCSALPACERQERSISESDRRQAQVSLFNATHDVLVLSTQSLHGDYRVDCDLVTDDPSRFLRADHLTSLLAMEILSGEERPLSYDTGYGGPSASAQPCTFTFVSPIDDRLEALATSWPTDLPTKEFFRDVDAPADVPPEPHTLIAEALYDDVDDDDLRPWRHRPCNSSSSLSLGNCSDDQYDRLIEPPPGATYHWSVIGDYPRQRSWEGAPIDEMELADDDGAQCHTGRSRTPLVWDTPPGGSWQVLDVIEVTTGANPQDQDETNNNGEEPTPPPIAETWTCYDVQLLQGESTSNWWSFCGSQRLAHRLESAGSSGRVFVEFFPSSRSDAPPSAYRSLTIDLERRTEDGERYEDEIFELVRGHGIPEHFGLTWSTEPRTECGSRREFPECDKVILPTRLRVQSTQNELEVTPGETIDLEPNSPARIEERRRLEFVRGFHRVVSDRSCNHESLGHAALAQVGSYVELIYYSGVTAVEN